MLFDEPTLRKLTRLTLVATQIRAGLMKGERRSSKRGTSLEFADYRNYTPGDDLRRLDWNVYARLDRPFMKLFEEEEDLAVHILVDASQSMDWGEAECNKFAYALRLAAALGAIALANGDRLTASALHAGTARPQFGPLRGQPSTLRMLQFFESQSAGGVTQLNRALQDYALAARRPGLLFLISDLFSTNGFQAGVSQLQSRGYEITVLHVLAPEEMDPPLAGDIRLVDVETGQAQEASVDGSLREQYRQRVQSWQSEIQANSMKRGVRYLPINTSLAWDKFVLQEMRKVGALK